MDWKSMCPRFKSGSRHHKNIKITLRNKGDFYSLREILNSLIFLYVYCLIVFLYENNIDYYWLLNILQFELILFNMKPILFQSPEIDLTWSITSKKKRLEEELIRWLDEFVVGQDEAKKALVRVVIQWLYNVYRDQWVLWAVFLAWPTGVWKTELARSLARTLLWDPSAITKIVAETMPHPADIAQMVWSPAWYVWYGDIPEMSDINIHKWYKTAKEKWKLHPLLKGYEAENFSIVLIDEAEKAHPDIPNAFLWAIQSGEMKMASWKESDSRIKHSKMTDLRNTLFIFTSNAWEHTIASSKSRSIWFSMGEGGIDQGDRDIFMRELKRIFAPEFIGRMDDVIRCHSLSSEELRRVFDLHTDRMNVLLAEKKYFSSFQVRTTRQYVDAVISGAWGIEYWARSIAPAIKNIGALTGMVIQSGRIPKDSQWILEFDIDSVSQSTVFKFLHTTWSQIRALTTDSISRTSVPEDTRNLVEGKISKHGDQLRDTVQWYLRLMAGYDTWFADTCRILERRLRWFGFNTKDIHDLQAAAFVAIYQSVEQPADYEIIVRYDEMFWVIGFRPIEKFLRTAIIRSLPLEEIYQTIRVLLKRPMMKDEAIVIAQHIHRLLQGKISK